MVVEIICGVLVAHFIIWIARTLFIKKKEPETVVFQVFPGGHPKFWRVTRDKENEELLKKLVEDYFDHTS